MKVGLLIISLIALTIIGLLTADRILVNDDRLLPNIHIAHIDVGGLHPAEAELKLNRAAEAFSKMSLIVTDQIDVWNVQPTDIDLTLNIKQAVTAAYSIGREHDFFQRWKTRLSNNRQIARLPVTVDFSRDKLAKTLSGLALQINRPARDAKLIVLSQTSTVAVMPSSDGRILDVEETIDQVFQTPQFGFTFVLNLVFRQIPPKIADSAYKGINTVLASYSTYFKPWNYERNANLRLAASRIHGKILKPGEIFSYNQNVGRRTQQEGFRMAPVILDGKLVPDWGGGVCQVSSTLYNAALYANLDIVERSNHGRAIGYVPLGFDATVVDGYIDFKFRNNLSHSLLIHSIVTDDELMFFILGDSSDKPPPIELDYIVHKVIEPVEIKQLDPSIEKGKEVVEEPPQRGFRVSSLRIRTINGKQITQLLALDDYDPVNKIIKVGTKQKLGEITKPKHKKPLRS